MYVNIYISLCARVCVMWWWDDLAKLKIYVCYL